MAARWFRALAAAPLALGLTLGSGLAAHALVPYTYVPRNEALEGAGLGLAQAAARLLQMGQAEDATRLAALSTQLLPNDPRSWVLLAEAELRSKNSKHAAVALARAKQLDPKNAGIWFAEGSLALRDNHPKQAIDLLRRGLELEKNNAGAYFDLDAGSAQTLKAQTCDQRIGVGYRGKNPGDAGANQCIAARASAALVGAGLERHVSRGAGGGVAPGSGVAQRHHFGVRTAHGLGVSLTYHLTAGRNQHATHSRVGCAEVLGLTGQF
jgi:tetratricopeptide (TPR) repeat protein